MNLSQAKEKHAAVIAIIIKMIAIDYTRNQEARQVQVSDDGVIYDATYDVAENTLTTSPEQWLNVHKSLVMGEFCATEIEWLLGSDDIDGDTDYEDAVETALSKHGIIRADDVNFLEVMDKWCGMVARVQSYIKTVEMFTN